MSGLSPRSGHRPASVSAPPPSGTPAGESVWLVDATLRDGAQAPGVVLAPHQRAEIAEALAAAGVNEIEAGCPAMGAEEHAAIRRVIALDLPCRLTGWCRAAAADLQAAAACGLSAVHLAAPGSDTQLAALGKCWPWVVDALQTLVPQARQRFGFVSVGLMDASRTAPARLAEVAQLCRQLGADRLRLADTLGVWNPRTAAAAVGCVRRAAPELAIGVHCHNDLGMAIGNTLAALEAGAVSADATVLGLGERAGNAALEELVMAIAVTTRMPSTVSTCGLATLCELVAACAGQTIPPRKPIVGGNIFRHESGIHVRGVLHDPGAFEPFSPESVGRDQRQLQLGTHSGRAGLAAALRTAGVQPANWALARLIDLIRQEAAATRSAVSPSRAATLYRELAP